MSTRQTYARRYLVPFNTADTQQIFTDCLVIGAGIAGLRAVQLNGRRGRDQVGPALRVERGQVGKDRNVQLLQFGQPQTALRKGVDDSDYPAVACFGVLEQCAGIEVPIPADGNQGN